MLIYLLSQSNITHNHNNKTTKNVVGLKQSDRREPSLTTTHRILKLHARAEIEQYSENKFIGLYKKTQKQYLNTIGTSKIAH